MSDRRTAALALALVLLTGCESNDQWADRWYSDHCAKLAASIERYERNSQQQVRSIIKQEYEKNRARWESTCRMVPK